MIKYYSDMHFIMTKNQNTKAALFIIADIV